MLICVDCENERRRKDDDALWNAAIEAAASQCDAFSENMHGHAMSGPGCEWAENEANAARRMATEIRALKRGGK